MGCFIIVIQRCVLCTCNLLHSFKNQRHPLLAGYITGQVPGHSLFETNVL
jgi:hypothetical protein